MSGIGPVRLLRITRLTDRGFSLPQIAGTGDADEHPGEALRTLDAELAATSTTPPRSTSSTATSSPDGAEPVSGGRSCHRPDGPWEVYTVTADAPSSGNRSSQWPR